MFYKLGGEGLSEEVNVGKVVLVECMFERYLIGMNLEVFAGVVWDVVGLSRYFVKRVMKFVVGVNVDVVMCE